jgi:hypothetical protein
MRGLNMPRQIAKAGTPVRQDIRNGPEVAEWLVHVDRSQSRIEQKDADIAMIQRGNQSRYVLIPCAAVLAAAIVASH